MLAIDLCIYVAADTGFLSDDDPMSELNGNEGGWNADFSLFADSDRLDQMADEPLFNSNDDSYGTFPTENPQLCLDPDQAPSRLRARSGVCPSEMNSAGSGSGSGTAVQNPPIPGTFTEQSDETKRQWCPDVVYQALLNIPVCSYYDDIQILSSDLTDFDTGKPLTATGLKTIVSAYLSRPLISTIICLDVRGVIMGKSKQADRRDFIFSHFSRSYGMLAQKGVLLSILASGFIGGELAPWCERNAVAHFVPAGFSTRLGVLVCQSD